jgi:hypothetical protein
VRVSTGGAGGSAERASTRRRWARLADVSARRVPCAARARVLARIREFREGFMLGDRPRPSRLSVAIFLLDTNSVSYLADETSPFNAATTRRCEPCRRTAR